MKGSIRGQIKFLFNASGLNKIGESKFGAKDSARIALAAEGRSGVSSNIAEKTGIHSLGTRDNYLGKMGELGKFVKEEFKVRDMTKITGEHVREFLNYKIEMGVSYSHWSGYACALGKLETALIVHANQHGHGASYDFRNAISQLRNEARAELPRFEGTRNYDSPAKMIAAIDNPSHRLVATIQYESGLRVAGASNIKESQLRGLATDKYSGKPVGIIAYVGKGGKAGIAQVSAALYQKVDTHIKTHGELRVGTDGYRLSLKEAAQGSGQSYNGSHGLRWCFAQGRFAELQANGVSYEKALGVVSDELGHNRIEITYHYLGL